MPVILARELRKRFGTVEAVRGLSFEVEVGECVGLLGPDGAGKTTTVSLVGCVSPPCSGQLKVLGMDVHSHGRQIRHRLGVVPEQDSLDPDLDARENLLVYASYFGIGTREAKRRADELLAFLMLHEQATAPIDKLSPNLRRRLLLARGLINRPELLILDEPTTGLDPQSRGILWQKLRRLKAAGTSMLLCTPSLEEATALSDRFLLMDHGQILAPEPGKEMSEPRVDREAEGLRHPQPQPVALRELHP